MGAKVLDVGQCYADQFGIDRLLRKCGADAVHVKTANEALDKLKEGGFDLVLVNRIIDADRSSGLELIHALKNDASLSAVPVMLVSDYADAQQQAVEAGALPGFGKAKLTSSETEERIKAALVRP